MEMKGNGHSLSKVVEHNHIGVHVIQVVIAAKIKP